MIGLRIILFILLISIIEIHSISAQPLQMEKVREQYFTMNKSKAIALNLYLALEKIDLSRDPVMLAYRGAASAASAGSVSGVRKKLEYFNHGKSELEKAVVMKNLDAEIRFLRLATQVSAPGFLGYTGDIKNDKAMIITTLNSVSVNHPNAYLYLRICRFLLEHTELNATEQNIVNQLAEKFNTKK